MSVNRKGVTTRKQPMRRAEKKVFMSWKDGQQLGND
jgi:hypothetical protein